MTRRVGYADPKQFRALPETATEKEHFSERATRMTRQELRAMMEGMFISALITLLLFLGGLSLLPPTIYWSIAIFAVLSGMLALYYELKGEEEWTRSRQELVYAMLIGVVILWVFFSGGTPLLFWGGIAFWVVFSVLAFLFDRRAKQKLERLAEQIAVYCPRCGTKNSSGARLCVKCGLQLAHIYKIIQRANTQRH